MEIKILEFMWVTGGSGGGNCPALIKAEGGYVVTGKKLGPDTMAQVRSLGAANSAPLGEDEDALFVPADVIDRIAG